MELWPLLVFRCVCFPSGLARQVLAAYSYQAFSFSPGLACQAMTVVSCQAFVFSLGLARQAITGSTIQTDLLLDYPLLRSIPLHRVDTVPEHALPFYP